MKVLSILASILSVLTLCNLSYGQGQPPPFRTVIMEMKIVEEGEEGKSEGMSKIWIDFEEEKYCVDSEMMAPDGGATRYVTIQSQGHVYVLNVQTKTAQEIPSDVKTNQFFGWKGLPDFIRFGGVKVGTDSVAGLPTDIYEYVRFEDDYPPEPVENPAQTAESKDKRELAEIMSPSGRQIHVRQWIWKGTQFPLKTIVNERDRQTTTETIHIAVDADIPERVFIVPQDYSMKEIQP